MRMSKWNDRILIFPSAAETPGRCWSGGPLGDCQFLRHLRITVPTSGMGPKATHNLSDGRRDKRLVILGGVAACKGGILVIFAVEYAAHNGPQNPMAAPPMSAGAKAAVIALLSAAIVGTLVYSAFYPARQRLVTTPPLLQRMEVDFPGMDALSGTWIVQLSPTNENYVTVIRYSDIRTLTKFVTFYVPNQNVFETCKHLADHLSEIIAGPPMMTVNGVPVQTKMYVLKRFEGDTNAQTDQNAVFTGAVYIYYEGYLSDEQRVELRKLFSDKKATLMFRGQEFLKLEAQ